jgi:putative membrane protein
MRKLMIVAATAAALGMSAIVSGAEPEKLDDAKIATIALTAHEIDVERGKLASKKTRNEEVKQLADQMVTDHGAGKVEVLDLATKLKVTPVQSAVTKGLKDGATQTAGSLKKLKGAAFDKAYVDAEVAYHQAVIDAVNTVLLPNVKNAEVKQLLVNTLPTLQGHLIHAQQLQTRLKAAM